MLPLNKTNTSVRFLWLDVMRGIAVAMMITFHFIFDMNQFHFVNVDFYHDAFWLNTRTLIVTLFLGLAGISLQLATSSKLNISRYYRRLLLLVGAALLVSFGSYLFSPDRVILFGVLHFIVLASVLGLLFRRLYWMNLLIGIGLVILGNVFQHAGFDVVAWHWIGLMTHKPITLDYVPLLPWFGVVLIGMFLARFTEKRARWVATDPVENPLVRMLALGGQHSLLIYLIHQPLLLGGLYLVMLF